MNALSCLALAGLIGGGGGGVPTVTYAELGDMVRAEKGKAVLVYVWANYCAPCKAKGLPYLAALHKKHAAAGLVVLAVCIDDASPDAQTRAAAAAQVSAFVAQRQLPFRCLNLHMPDGKLPAGLNFGDGVPKCFVFGRDNRFVLRLPDTDEKGATVREFRYDDIETAINEALGAK